MKILVPILLTLLSFAGFTQEKVKWYTLEEAEELNKKKPRIFLIDVYTDWCGWCKEMDRVSFSHPVIAEYLNTHFYPVKLNAETRDTIRFGGHIFINKGTGQRPSHDLAISLLKGKMSYPSIVYLNSKYQLLTVVPGFVNPKQLEPILAYFATESYKTNPDFQSFSNSFKSKIE